MNIHVGNLSRRVTDSDLHIFFSVFGKVEKAEVIINSRTGEPLGYGFVVMPSEEEGAEAIATLHEKPWMGSVITVTKAHRVGGRNKSRGRHR